MKKKNLIFIAASILVTVFAACKKEAPKHVNVGDPNLSSKPSLQLSALPTGNWNLVFNDDFNGTALDLTKWSYGFGWGPKSDAFLETTRPANVAIAGGIAKIKMECDASGAYWSGAINTRNKFSQTKGYWEARIKLPTAQAGLLPAFWMKPNNESWPPEIDIIEVFGASPIAKMSIHYGIWPNNYARGYSWDGGDLSTQFHIFGMEWDTDFVKWYIDGTLRAQILRTSSGGANFLDQINAVGGMYTMLNIHSWPGDEAGKLGCSILPVYMDVDYVKIYQKSTTPPSTVNRISNPGFETGDFNPWTQSQSSVSSTLKRTGNYGATTWWGGSIIQQISGLSPNTTYTLTGWGKVDKAGVTGKIAVSNFNSTGNELSSPFTSNTIFEQKSVTFTTGINSTSAKVKIYAPSDGLITIDDLELQ